MAVPDPGPRLAAEATYNISGSVDQIFDMTAELCEMIEAHALRTDITIDEDDEED